MLQAAVFLLLIALSPLSGYPFAEFSEVFDDFNRADADPIDGIWTDSLSGASAGCVVDNNRATRPFTTNDGCYVTTGITQGNQQVYGVLPEASTHNDFTAMELYLCLANAGTAGNDGYGVQFTKRTGTTDTIAIVRRDNGTNTQLGASINQEADDGDQIGLYRYDDDTTEAWYKDTVGSWTEVGERSDTTYTCANTTFGMRIGSSTHSVDDFTAGGEPAATGSPGIFLLLGR